MNEIQNTLIEIAKCAMNGTMLTESGADLREVFKLAQLHGIEHLLGLVIDNEALKDITFKKVLKSMNQAGDADEILEKCEEKGIFILPLKGYCTRKHYKVIDVRSMGDIDMLYKSEQHKELLSMMKSLCYEWGGENRKHDHYIKKPYTSIEMHRGLVSNDSGYYDYYQGIWDRCVPKNGYKYVYEMPIEDEFIFNIVHLVGHFKKGGIGIRLIMDIFVYDNLEMDRDRLESELEKLGLKDFYHNISKLASKWFGGAECNDEIVLKLEDFILGSGLYGNDENVYNSRVSDSKIKYLMNMCFPPLRSMQSAYLYLEKYPVLLPYAWVARGFKVLFHRRKSLKTVSNNVIKGDSKKGRELMEFFKECGL